MFKYGVISGPYFPVFSPNTGKDGTEITPYLDTFHTVNLRVGSNKICHENVKNERVKKDSERFGKSKNIHCKEEV